MLAVVGLLTNDNIEQIPFAYKLFMNSDNNAGAEVALRFKETFCRDIGRIDFLGVW